MRLNPAIPAAVPNQSSTFPTKNSLQPYRAISSSFGSIFVTKFSPSGSPLVYSTFLGGSLESTSSLYSLAVDPAGNAFVAGGTRSTDFPTKNALYPTFLGGYADGFVTKIASQATAGRLSTFCFCWINRDQERFSRGLAPEQGTSKGPAIELIAGSYFFRLILFSL